MAARDEPLGFKKLQLVTAITLVALPLVAALVSARLAAVGNAAFAYFVINAWQDRIDAHLANGGARAPLWKALLHAARAAAVMAVVFLGAVALVAPTS